jgi:hypothetical protein
MVASASKTLLTGGRVVERISTEAGVLQTMADHDVLANQKSILEHQKTILDNQETIKKNQHSLEQILKNQTEIVKNQEKILSLLHK